MKYLLDTSTCVHFFRGRYGVENKLKEAGVENCAISEVTLAELVYGAEKSADPEKNHTIINSFVTRIPILPIVDSVLVYGKEKVRLRNQGIMISEFDLLIGCAAIEKDLIMVTDNIKHFDRIKNIKIENWVQR